MPRPLGSVKIPSYCHHKAKNLAYVTIEGHQIYLGPHGSAESRAEYDRIIGRFLAAGRNPTTVAPTAGTTDVTISMLLAAFWTGTEKDYKGAPAAPGKRPQGERGNFFDVIKLLRRLYGETLAADFDSLALDALRREMIKMDWCRNNINRQVHRIRLIFQWGVTKKMVAAGVWQDLRALRPLRQGRSEARETEAVKPVPQEVLDATLPHLGPYVRAMVQLLLHTGMRAGEMVIMRTGDISTAGKVWIYRPEHHKTEHFGHVREVRIGPKAQRILEPFLKTDLNAYAFSPAEAETWRHSNQRKNRATPLTPSQIKRGAEAKRRRRRRPPLDHYTVASFRRAITRACDRADRLAEGDRGPDGKKRLVPDWHPHQLRHNFATLIRKKHGSEAALVLLGDKTTRMIDIYAEKDAAIAERVIVKVG